MSTLNLDNGDEYPNPVVDALAKQDRSFQMRPGAAEEIFRKATDHLYRPKAGSTEFDILVYVVKQISDLTEGRGPMVSVKYFLNEDDAWNYADCNGGVMGRKPSSGSWRNEKYGDWQVEEVTVYASLQSAIAADDQAIKEKALSKLTETERRVLGL